MPRRCGPCDDKRRNEIDRRLLNKEISGESFRRISSDFGYSEIALRRHLANHLIVDLATVKAAKDEARRKAEAEVQARETEKALAEVKTEVQIGMAERLENAANFLDQLKEVRNKAATLLELAEEAEDLRAAGTFLRELREQIRLWAELEKKMDENPPQINFTLSAEWIELRTTILYALDPFPEAKLAIVRAIRGPDYDKWDDGPNPGAAEVKP